MREEELAEIRERNSHYRSYDHPGDALGEAMDDIDTLLAEIDRLRAENEELRQFGADE
jgi:hypothetical protein